MKHILFPLLLVTVLVHAGPPAAIEPKTKIIRNIAWYNEQAGQWKQQVQQSPTANGWLSYYAASRYAQASKSDLDQITAAVLQSVPGTVEAAVVQSWNEGFSERSFTLLKDAYRFSPGNTATYSLLTLFHEFNGNSAERKAMSLKLLESDQVSRSLLSYSYNVLMSAEVNAVLFTEGENTTVPLFILQDVMNVRPDVIVLDLDMLEERNYLVRKLRESSLVFSNTDQVALAADQKRMLCASLPSQNPGRKFYYALTIGRENISEIKDQLYVVGLASQISKERLDNISIIKQNIENRFLLDYLTVDLNGESEFSAGRVLSPNYLVPMLMLDDYYLKSGDVARSKQLEQIVVKLAEDGGKSELVDNFLRKDKLSSPILMPINTREVEETFRIIRDNLYAMNAELTNRQYNSFIDFLITSKQTELYEKCRIDLSHYEGTSLAFFKGYHTYIKEAGKGRARDPFGDYPVVNISHEAAVAYCEWLTLQYNASAEKKYKKVKFRLPTLNEWQIAALGYNKFQTWEIDKNTVRVVVPKDSTAMIDKKGEERTISAADISYPWFGAFNYRNKIQNKFNCFLANIKAPDDCEPCKTPSIGKDGFSMMGRTSSYFPNDIGLYDVIGNVAEMIDVSGKACGGSWNDSAEESTIRSVKSYAGPDASVGFRIFMEVIEK